MGMPSMIYSDVEVHAKIVMDPDTMVDAMHSIRQLLDEYDCRQRHSSLYQVGLEMEKVLSRMADMGIVPQEVLR